MVTPSKEATVGLTDSDVASRMLRIECWETSICTLQALLESEIPVLALAI